MWTVFHARAAAAAARRLAALGLGLCAALGAAAAQPAGEPAAAAPEAAFELPLAQVAPGVYFVQGRSELGSAANRNFISNAGFVIGEDGVLVVDALGSPALAQALVEHVRALTPLPIRYVVATHYHADHVYGLQVLRALGARVVAHAGAREYLASETARRRLEASRTELFPWVDEDTRLVEPDIWVGEDGRDAELRLSLGRTEVVVRHAGPSHTQEDLVVHVPSRRVLFAGDLVFRGRIPYVGQADSRAWIAALERLLALDAAVVVPGHGPASTTPREDIALTRDYLAYLRRTMGEAARAMEPFDEAYARTDWSRFSRLPLFGPANRMNAYNTYLQMEQENR